MGLRLFTFSMLCALLAKAMDPLPDTKPLPYIQNVIHYMDNCAGTNKSQYCFGALALLIMTGQLTGLWIKFMVSGHTKFESDVAAQKTAGSFNRSDCFNHGMLVKLFSPYVNAKAYDGELLKLYKETTANLFKPINNITKYRQFTFLGDDGTGEVDKDLQKTAGEEGWPDGGDFYTDESLTTAAENAAERSLKVLLPIVCGDGAPGVQYLSDRREGSRLPT